MAMLQVESIDEMTRFIRETELGGKRLGELASEHHDSFNSTVARINGEYKRDGKDLWVKHAINTKQCRVFILVITLSERIEIKNNINEKNRYENEKPEGFHDETEYWPVGSWHD